jgi:hypothetical protein
MSGALHVGNYATDGKSPMRSSTNEIKASCKKSPVDSVGLEM